MLTVHKKFIEICKAKGLNVTLQRMAIYTLLQRRNDHPTVDDIYRDVKQEHPTISRSTVYNTLELLSEHDMIRRVTRLHDIARYDHDTTPHHHLVCRGCGKVHDIPVEEKHTIKIPPKVRGKFQIINYSIQFDGFCPSCAKPHLLSDT